ncbi:MAG: hypothetical protein ACJAQ2_001779, partial [Vicingaceae bacterium]
KEHSPEKIEESKSEDEQEVKPTGGFSDVSFEDL